MHAPDNRKAGKRKARSYADIAKVAKRPVSENKSSNVNIFVTSKIYVKSMLLKDEKLNSSRIAISLSNHINDTLIFSNSPGSFRKSVDFETFDTKDHKLLDILEEVGNAASVKEKDVNVKNLGRLRGYFCSKYIFSLSHRELSDAEIKLLEKGLEFATIQVNTNEPKLREDFNKFCRSE